MLEYYGRFYPGTAQRRYIELMEKLHGLSSQPLKYPEFEPKPQYRRMVSGDYLTLYSVDEEEKMVRVYRVIPGKLNLDELLK